MPFPHLDIAALITAIGYVGIFCIICAESWLFFGVVLPGDSLLFTAGLMASGGLLNIWVLLIIVPAAAVLGDSLGYWFGTWVGPRIFTREDSLFFNKRHITRSEKFYEKYGARAVLLARFMPVVRTFIPILAGVGSMRYGTFVFYNILGGLLWGAGVLLLGYFLGRSFPAAEQYLMPIILAVVLISFLPLVYEWRQSRKN